MSLLECLNLQSRISVINAKTVYVAFIRSRRIVDYYTYRRVGFFSRRHRPAISSKYVVIVQWPPAGLSNPPLSGHLVPTPSYPVLSLTHHPPSSHTHPQSSPRTIYPHRSSLSSWRSSSSWKKRNSHRPRARPRWQIARRRRRMLFRRFFGSASCRRRFEALRWRLGLGWAFWEVLWFLWVVWGSVGEVAVESEVFGGDGRSCWCEEGQVKRTIQLKIL